MPPRTRREAPRRRDARIHKHLLIAGEYWGKCPIYLADGDLRQAGEKGWGAVAQLTKAVATLRGWEHYDHVAIREAVQALADELPDAEDHIRRGLNAAQGLHGNFYESYMTREQADFNLATVAPLLNTLWGQIPGEYTGGVSFSDWVERAAAPVA